MLSAFDIIKKYQNLIEENNWITFYYKLHFDDNIGRGLIGTVTQLLLDADVDPSLYMKGFPSYYLYGTDIKSFICKNSNAEVIGQKAFSRCYELKEVDFTISKIEKIQPYAFSDCEKLKEIRLPFTVRDVADNAFEDCINLEEVYIDCNREDFKGNPAYLFPIECDIIFTDQVIKGIR